MTTTVLAPETLEGWYALHQLFSVDHRALRSLVPEERRTALEEARETLFQLADPVGGGWSRMVPLVGSRAQLMLIHFRPTLDSLALVQRSIRRLRLHDLLDPVYAFLSVAELGLYRLTAELAKETAEVGRAPGDDEYRRVLAERVEAERRSPFAERRLYPMPPADMPYVCFYPMSKRRQPDQNWYASTLEERSRLMYAHSVTGRRYAGRVQQIITGAIGLAEWEWGVTLFGRDPLDFKRLVTEMRFDEVSAKYAEFGDFFVGRTADPEEWTRSLDE